MTDSRDKDETNDLDFSWGKQRKKSVKNKGVQFYESFTYDGVEYSLYDSVYLFTEGEDEPYIGKIIKIWEQSGKTRKVKVLWFFKPSEISYYLGDGNVLENELFLASGEGVGLANVNPLEAIAGKCNVICISKDERNCQPSVEELEKADYVFYRTLDVGNQTISDKLGEKIATIEVRLLLNTKSCDKNLDNVVAGIERPLISVKHTPIDDEATKPDTYEGALMAKDDLGREDVVNRRKLLAPENHDATGSDDTCPMAVLAPEQALVSGQEPRSVSPDLNQTDLDKVIESAVSVAQSECKTLMKSKLGGSSTYEETKDNGPKLVVESGSDLVKNLVPSSVDDKRKSELVNDVHGGSIDSVGKVKSPNSRGATEERPSKKLKTGGTVGPPSNKHRNGVQNSAVSNATNRASNPVAAASTAEPTGGGGKVAESDGTHSTPSKKLKSECTGGGPAASVATETKTRGKLGKELVGTSNGLSKKLKFEGGGSGSADAFGAETNGIVKPGSKLVGMDDGIIKKLDSASVKGKSNERLHKASLKQSETVEVEAYGRVKEVTRRPEIGKSSWFTAAHWKERMEDAQVQNKLVLLQNLDPAYTSSEVEDIVWHGFGESCSAKMVQRTAISSPHSGEAFVIFKSRKAAEKVCNKLDQECLMLPNGRPLVGSIWLTSFAGTQSSFPGHILIDKLRHQLQREAKAVSTSHSSQPNTLEYEMAVEWRVLQDRAEMWWKLYDQRQEGGELRKLKARLKSK